MALVKWLLEAGSRQGPDASPATVSILQAAHPPASCIAAKRRTAAVHKHVAVFTTCVKDVACAVFPCSGLATAVSRQHWVWHNALGVK